MTALSIASLFVHLAERLAMSRTFSGVASPQARMSALSKTSWFRVRVPVLSEAKTSIPESSSRADSLSTNWEFILGFGVEKGVGLRLRLRELPRADSLSTYLGLILGFGVEVRVKVLLSN